MKRKINKSEIFFPLIIVALCYISFFLCPNISNINFLAHSLTIFSISLAMVAFISPILRRYRNNLILSESDNNRDMIKKLSDSISEMDKHIEEIDLELQDKELSKSQKKDLLDEKNGILQIKSDFEEHKLFFEQNSKASFSKIITRQFRIYKIWIKICLIMIVLLILVNHLLFTSPVFSSFIHKTFPSITNMYELKIGISNFINLLTLAAQLYFLYAVCMSSMETLVRLNK